MPKQQKNIINIYMDVNAEDAIRKMKQFEDKMLEAFRITIIETMRRIGIVSTSKYMTAREWNPSSGLGGRRSDKLHINTGRLATSLLDGFNLREQNRLAGVKEGIRELTVKSGGRIVGKYGTEVPYAVIHEMTGAKIPKTEKSRRFFWAMWYKTKQDFWKGMALSRKDFFNIPPRPYLKPALDDVQTEMPGIFIDRIKQILKTLGG